MSIKRITLKDIALKTGFSVNTVSKALRDMPDLSDSTKDYIRTTADNMGYVMNDMASALRSGFTNVIALIVSDISNPFFGILAKEVESYAMQYKYTVIVFNTEENLEREEKAIRTAIAKNVDGVLLVPTQHNSDGIELLIKAGKPCVLIGRYFNHIKADSVVFSDEKGGYEAVMHLLEKDYKNILMINAPINSSAHDRLLGYRRALSEYGLSADNEHVITVGSALGGVREELSKLILSGRKFDGVFAYSDLIAFEAICVLKEFGYRVPDDIGVIGFDDIQSKLSIPFPLSTVCVPKSELAEALVKLLMKRISGDTSDFPIKDVLDTKLIIRGSTR